MVRAVFWSRFRAERLTDWHHAARDHALRIGDGAHTYWTVERSGRAARRRYTGPAGRSQGGGGGCHVLRGSPIRGHSAGLTGADRVRGRFDDRRVRARERLVVSAAGRGEQGPGPGPWFSRGGS